jgi:branched-subunit amino acid ABC-type transport system permease component
VRDVLEDLLGRASLITIAAAIALGYALLNLAQGVSVLVLSIFTEQGDQFSSSGGPLSLKVGGRVLEFAQLISGLVTLAVVLAVILYVLRPDQRRASAEKPDAND